MTMIGGPAVAGLGPPPTRGAGVPQPVPRRPPAEGKIPDESNGTIATSVRPERVQAAAAPVPGGTEVSVIVTAGEEIYPDPNPVRVMPVTTPDVFTTGTPVAAWAFGMA